MKFSLWTAEGAGPGWLSEGVESAELLRLREQPVLQGSIVFVYIPSAPYRTAHTPAAGCVTDRHRVKCPAWGSVNSWIACASVRAVFTWHDHHNV